MRSQRKIRAYLPATYEVGASIELDKRNIHHFHAVLRLRNNDRVVLFNGTEQLEAKATITSLNKKNGSLLIEVITPVKTESSLNTCLWQAVSRSDRMDFAIQKSVELGISSIQPVTTERSPLRLKDKKLEKKMQHWQGIIISACEQSGRTVLPTIQTPMLIDKLLAKRDPDTAGILLDPQANRSLREISKVIDSTDILIGPEGGLTEDEIIAAKKAGFINYQLGPRILRTETAAISVLSYLQHHFGDAA